METITWIGFSQGLFAAILMLAKHNRNVSDKLLTAWLTLLAIEFLTCAIDYTLFGYPLLSSSFLLFNPAFYVYVQSLIDIKFRLKWLQLIHLIPFIFFEIFSYVLHEPYMLEHFLKCNSTLWFRSLFSFASLLSWIAYNYITANTLFRHRKRLVNEFSNIESNKSVSWLLFVVIFYNLYCFAAVAIAASSVFVDISFPLSPIYNYSAMLLMVYIFGFYGLKQQIIYREVEVEVEIDKAERYSQSLLSSERKEEIREKIEYFFKHKKPYLNPELNMDMISKTLKFPKHQITEVLNMEIGKNFFQFVNEFRVNEVKIMLKNPNNPFSIEAIGYECGFSSKSSFFTVFKRLTGLTPQQYRNEVIGRAV